MPPALKPLTGDLQLNFLEVDNELRRIRESYASLTAPTTPMIGEQWFDKTGNRLKYYNNSRVATQVGTGDGTVTSVTAGTGMSFTAITSTGAVAIDTTVVATTTNSLVMSNKTLTTPTIASFTNATHDHSNAAGGGVLPQASLIAAGGVGFIGQVVDTANRTTAATTDGTATAIVALTFTFTVVASAVYRIRTGQETTNNGANSNYLQIWQGNNSTGTKKVEKLQFIPAASASMMQVAEYIGTLTAGSQTINVYIKTSAGTMTLLGANAMSFLTIERLS